MPINKIRFESYLRSLNDRDEDIDDARSDLANKIEAGLFTRRTAIHADGDKAPVSSTFGNMNKATLAAEIRQMSDLRFNAFSCEYPNRLEDAATILAMSNEEFQTEWSILNSQRIAPNPSDFLTPPTPSWAAKGSPQEDSTKSLSIGGTSSASKGAGSYHFDEERPANSNDAIVSTASLHPPFTRRSAGKWQRFKKYFGLSQVTYEVGLLHSITLEPGPGPGIKTGENFQRLTAPQAFYDETKYGPLNNEIRPGPVASGESKLRNAYRIAAKQINRADRGGAAATPLPNWVLDIQEFGEKALKNLRHGRLTSPRVSMPSREQLNRILSIRSNFKEHVRVLFPGATPRQLGAFLVKLSQLGVEPYPTPPYQKQYFMVTTLAQTSGNRIDLAFRALNCISNQLLITEEDKAAISNPAAQEQIRRTAYRTAQILANAEAPGWKTLLKAGILRDDEDDPVPFNGQDPRLNRQQNALRIFFEASNKFTEDTGIELDLESEDFKNRLGNEADRSFEMLVMRAARKLVENPNADLLTSASVPAAEKLTREEKNAYYFWSMGFGQKAAQDENLRQKTIDRMYKMWIVWPQRAQDNYNQATRDGDFNSFASQAAPTNYVKTLKRVIGKEKSPYDGWASWGTRGHHLRYPVEVQYQYDSILRPLIRTLQHHFHDQHNHWAQEYQKLIAGNSKASENAKHRTLRLKAMYERKMTNLDYWAELVLRKNAAGEYSRRPLEGEFLPAAPAAPNAKTTHTPFNLNILLLWARTERVDGRPFAPVSELNPEEAITQNSALLINQKLSDEVLEEFGLSETSRRNLPMEIVKARLFEDVQRDGGLTLKKCFERLREISQGDRLRPEINHEKYPGDNFIDAHHRFANTQNTITPMGPRSRSIVGGTVGVGNIALAMALAELPLAIEFLLTRKREAVLERNSAGHGGEIAGGVQTTIQNAYGLGAAYVDVYGDRILAFFGGALVGGDITKQQFLRFRAERRLNDFHEGEVCADAPGSPNHGKLIMPARDVHGNQKYVDESGNVATVTQTADGSQLYTYDNDPTPLVKKDGAFYLRGREEEIRPPPIFEKHYVFEDGVTPATNFERQDKWRFHLKEIDNFFHAQQRYAKDNANTAHALTKEQLWNNYVDTFFRNESVSISYQTHTNASTKVTGRAVFSARGITHIDGDDHFRPGGVPLGGGGDFSPYFALNRSDSTGVIARTVVQVGWAANAMASTSGSFGVGEHSLSPDAPSDGQGAAPASSSEDPQGVQFPSAIKFLGATGTFGDVGRLTTFRTVKIHGELKPEFTYMDIEYRDVHAYRHAILKNRAVWDCLYGRENVEKKLHKLEHDSQANQRFTERWRMSPTGVKDLESYITRAKIKRSGAIDAKRARRFTEAEEQEIMADAMTAFCVETMSDRTMWQPLGEFTVEQNSVAVDLGPNLVIKAQTHKRVVGEREMDWIGLSSKEANARAEKLWNLQQSIVDHRTVSEDVEIYVASFGENSEDIRAALKSDAEYSGLAEKEVILLWQNAARHRVQPLHVLLELTELAKRRSKTVSEFILRRDKPTATELVENLDNIGNQSISNALKDTILDISLVREQRKKPERHPRNLMRRPDILLTRQTYMYESPKPEVQLGDVRKIPPAPQSKFQYPIADGTNRVVQSRIGPQGKTPYQRTKDFFRIGYLSRTLDPWRVQIAAKMGVDPLQLKIKKPTADFRGRLIPLAGRIGNNWTKPDHLYFQVEDPNSAETPKELIPNLVYKIDRRGGLTKNKYGPNDRVTVVLNPQIYNVADGSPDNMAPTHQKDITHINHYKFLVIPDSFPPHNFSPKQLKELENRAKDRNPRRPFTPEELDALRWIRDRKLALAGKRIPRQHTTDESSPTTKKAPSAAVHVAASDHENDASAHSSLIQQEERLSSRPPEKATLELLTEEEESEKRIDKSSEALRPRSTPVKSMLQNTISRLRKQTPREQIRGVWDGETFVGTVIRQEKGIVYFEQHEAAPDKPQPSSGERIIRAVKATELSGPVLDQQKYRITIPFAPETDALPLPSEKSKKISDEDLWSQLSGEEQERFKSALLNEFKNTKPMPKLVITEAPAGAKFTKKKPLLIDSMHRAYYYTPGRGASLKIAVVTLQRRGGEKIVEGVESTIHCDRPLGRSHIKGNHR